MSEPRKGETPEVAALHEIAARVKAMRQQVNQVLGAARAVSQALTELEIGITEHLLAAHERRLTAKD